MTESGNGSSQVNQKDQRSQSKHVSKRRWCLNCGHRIPVAAIALAYASGMLLKCTKCGRFTSAVEVDEVAGNFIDIDGSYGNQFVMDTPEVPVWERQL